MKLHFRIGLAVALALGVAGPAGADRLLDQMKARLSQVRDYTCDLTLNATLPQIAVSNMRMTLYYKRPGKVHIEAKEGFALMPEEGLYLGDPVEGMLATHTLEPMGPATWQGRKCVKYALRPRKDQRSPLASPRLYVDPASALPIGFYGKGRDMGEFQTSFTFRLFQGKYWLPTRTVLTLTGQPGSPERDGSGKSHSTGTARVDYANYRINTGLPDSLFVPPSEKGQGKRTPR